MSRENLTDLPATPRVELKIEPNFLEVRRALSEIRARFAPILAEDPIGTIEIVGAELLNNVVEHGFADRNGDGCAIEICASIDANSLKLLVVDNGAPMPGGAVPGQTERAIDPMDVDGLPEGGFGWNLIHMLSDDLTYSRADGKNHTLVSIGI